MSVPTIGNSNYFIPSTILENGTKSEESERFPSRVVDVDSLEDLEKKIRTVGKNRLAVVLFSTEWCKPCKKYYPFFEKIAKRGRGKYLFIRVKKTDAIQKMNESFKISFYPTLKVFGKHLPKEGSKVLYAYHRPLLKILPQYLLPEVERSRLDKSNLIKILIDPNPEVRSAAVFDAAKILGEEAISYLQVNLEREPDPEARLDTAFALSNINSPAATEALRKTFIKSSLARPESLTALGLLRPNDILQLSICGLHDPKKEVRYAAVKNLVDRDNYPLGPILLSIMVLVSTNTTAHSSALIGLEYVVLGGLCTILPLNECSKLQDHILESLLRTSY